LTKELVLFSFIRTALTKFIFTLLDFFCSVVLQVTSEQHRSVRLVSQEIFEELQPKLVVDIRQKVPPPPPQALLTGAAQKLN